MKTTGVSNIPKFRLLFFLGHPSQQAWGEEEDKYTMTALEPTVILESRRFIQHKHQVYVPCAGLLLFSYCLIRHQMAFCCDKLTLCWHKQQFNIKSISTVLTTRVHQSQIKKGKGQTMIIKSIVPVRYLSWNPPSHPLLSFRKLPDYLSFFDTLNGIWILLLLHHPWKLLFDRYNIFDT